MQHQVKGVWLTVLFSAALNVAGSYMAFEKPALHLDLDMIGTLIASVILGPLWGMGTGILTHLITSCRHDYLLFFTSVNVAGALYWGTVAQLGGIPLLRNSNFQLPEKDSEVLHKTSIVIVVLGFLGGAVTSIPAWFLHEKLVHTNHLSHVAGRLAEHDGRLLAELAHAVPDKILAAVAGIMIASFFFRYSAVRLTETYCNKRDVRKSLSDAFIYDTKGLVFSGLVAGLYVARLFNGSKPASAAAIFSDPSLSLPLLWFVPVPLAGGIARCFAGKREGPSVPMINKDLAAPNMKLCILVLAGMACWFIFWSARLGPTATGYAGGLYQPHTDLYLLASLLLLLMIFLLQDWKNSHLDASIREARIREEIKRLEADRQCLAAEVSTLHDNLEEWQISLESARTDSNQATALAEELFEELTKQFEQHKKVIEEKDEALRHKQALLDTRSEDRLDTPSGKREVMLLKVLFPHLMFHNRAVKEVCRGIGHDTIKKRTVTGFLQMLDDGKSLRELCEKYECNEMLEARKGNTKTYRLKEGRCRVYFYLPPPDYGNVHAEIISVIYDKNTRRIPDHVKDAIPSWS